MDPTTAAPAAGGPDPAGWQRAGLLVAGALASFVPMMLAISAIEGGLADPTGIDGDLYAMLPLAFIGLIGSVLARRRPRVLAFAAGWTATQGTFIALTTSDPWPIALAALAGWGTLAVPLPAPVRLALALPVTLLAVWAVAEATGESGQWLAASGLFAATAGLAYFVGWGWTEPVAWARHTAWALAFAWSALVAAIALGDLVTFGDPAAIAGVALAGLFLAAVPALWRWAPRPARP